MDTNIVRDIANIYMEQVVNQQLDEKEDSSYEKASDAALDARYGYGRAQGDKRSFGRAANRASAAAALRAIRRGERSGSGTSTEAGADAVHQGWARTAKTSSDQTPEKKAKRAQLADTEYKDLPDDEQEKDRVSYNAVKAVHKARKQGLSASYEMEGDLVDENLVGNQHRIDINRNNTIDSEDLSILRSKKRSKKIKEGFSNWRQDLSEVMDTIEKEENDKEIAENPNIKNKIKINPNLGEAVNGLGGTLLEMTEIGNFEGVFDELSESDIFFLTDDLIEAVVEEVFIESLKEGYNVFEIENTLLESLEVSSALLNEAKVTYGHDTDVKSDRLEKVKSAVKKVGKGILRGAGYVAGAAVRGAKAVGRELGAGYKRGRYGSGGSSESDSSSDSSSSGGSSRVTQGRGSSRPGILGRIGSALKKGLKRILHKGAKSVERGASSVARRTADNDGVRSASPRSGIGGGKKIEVTGSKESKVTQGKGKTKTADQEEPVKKVSVKDVTVTPKKTEVRTGQPGSERKALPPAQSSDRRKKAAAKAADEAQGSTSSGVRIAGAGGVSPLATTKKAAETYSKPASGAPKRPAKKTKVTAATPATPQKPQSSTTTKSSRRKPQDDKTNGKLDDLLKSMREGLQLSEMSISKDQQKLFGLALSVKRGETPRSEVSAEVLKIVDSMSEKKIRDFAKTSHEGLPKKVQTKEEAIREALRDRMLEKIEEQQIDEFFGGGPKTVLPKSTQLSGSIKPVTPGTKYPAKLGGKDVDVTYNKQGGRTVSPTTQTQTPKPGIGARAATGLAASRERLNQFNQMNSYELEGSMFD